MLPGQWPGWRFPSPWHGSPPAAHGKVLRRFLGADQASQLQISLGWAQDSAGVAGHSSSPGCGRLSKSDRRAISEQAGGLSPVCPNMHPSDDCLAPESARTEPTRPPQPSGAPGRMDAGVDPVPRSHRSRSVPVP